MSWFDIVFFLVKTSLLLQRLEFLGLFSTTGFLLGFLLPSSSGFVLFLLFAPVGEVAISIHVVLWESEELKGGQQELLLSLNGASQLRVISWVILEKLRRLHKGEICQPLVEQSINESSIKFFDLFWDGLTNQSLKLRGDILLSVSQVLLESDPL